MNRIGNATGLIFIGLVLIVALLVGESSVLTPAGSSGPDTGIKMELMPSLPLAASDVGANYTLRVSSPNGTAATIELSSLSPSGLMVLLSPSRITTGGGVKQVTVEIRASASLAPEVYPIEIYSTSPAGVDRQTFTVKVVKYLVVTGVLRPSFDPANLTVPVGSTVYWVRLNGAFGFYDNGYHQVLFTGIGVQSPDFLDQYQTWSYTFDQTGSFLYHCDFHALMKGVVNVVGLD